MSNSKFILATTYLCDSPPEDWSPFVETDYFLTHLTTDENVIYSNEEQYSMFWQEWLQEVVGEKLEQGKEYKTVLMVELIYTRDYFGEHDMDWEIDVLFHEEILRGEAVKHLPNLQNFVVERLL